MEYGAKYIRWAPFAKENPSTQAFASSSVLKYSKPGTVDKGLLALQKKTAAG